MRGTSDRSAGSASPDTDRSRRRTGGGAKKGRSADRPQSKAPNRDSRGEASARMTNAGSARAFPAGREISVWVRATWAMYFSSTPGT